MKFKTIYNTGIEILGDSNGSRTYVEVFTNDKEEQYKIEIKSESYITQSYAKLYKWSTTDGWLQIVNKNPRRQFGVDISYKDNFSVNVFDPIIKDLKKLAESF